MDALMERLDRNRYWMFHQFAVEAAQAMAAGSRRRYRVQRVTWLAPDWARWYIAPTPAEAPVRVAVEPCS